MSDQLRSLLTGPQIAKHSTKDDCWVVVSGHAYDVTDFLDEHPGGAAIILKYAGKDATAEYDPIHPPGTIEKSLSKDKHKGQVDMSTIATVSLPQDTHNMDDNARMPLAHMMNLDDMEIACEKFLSRAAWTYFHSAADSLGSLANNRGDWKKVTFRPRIMRDVKRVDMRRKMFGSECRLPVFIAPAARARVVHEDGELCLARGAGRAGIAYCPSTYSTVEHDELMTEFQRCKAESETGLGAMWFQLYVAKKNERTVELIEMAKRLGFTALVITVDTPVVGKREEDERFRAELSTVAGDDSQLLAWKMPQQLEGEDAPVLRGHHSTTLNWDDLKWIREAWAGTGPIALKGIQTVEDALMAAEHGIDAIYLSNHGGRQCDDAPSSIRTLVEIRKFHPSLLKKMEVYMDGGVRRGADILKALALGATGVGLGRPFMYSCAYGNQGVEKVISCESFQMLKLLAWLLTSRTVLSEEIETTMRLIGVTSLDQLTPNYVNTKLLDPEIPDAVDWSDGRSWMDRLRSKL
jgi:L-lactate dehydrogenase (cytochrome)